MMKRTDFNRLASDLQLPNSGMSQSPEDTT